MMAKTNLQQSKFDSLKWLLITLLISFSVVLNFHYSAEPVVWRVLGILALTIVALGIASQTARGRLAWRFVQDSRIELRQVIWPKREETVQVTLLVGAVVLLTGFLLWILDSILLRVVAFLTGQGA